MRTLSQSRDTCSEGTHVVGTPPQRSFRECRKCGVSEQTIYGNPRNAALGDFRVVCATDGCGYGDRIDANGHGYTNHVLLVLAKSSLRRHQRAVDGQHAVKIQQHPIEAVIDADETKARSVRR